MANTSRYVTTGKPNLTGAIYHAALGATLPTDAVTKLTDDYTCLGYVSEDGVTNSIAPDTDTIKAWGGDPVLYINNGKEDTFGMTLIEAMNVDVLKAIYNSSNVTGDLSTGITVRVNNEDAEEGVWVIDMILRGGVLKRIVIPDGKITDIGEIAYTDSDAVGYEITVSGLPSSEIGGDMHREYVKDKAEG